MEFTSTVRLDERITLCEIEIVDNIIMCQINVVNNILICQINIVNNIIACHIKSLKVSMAIECIGWVATGWAKFLMIVAKTDDCCPTR